MSVEQTFFQKFGPILAALGIGGVGTTGVTNQLDLFGTEALKNRVKYLESQVDSEKTECLGTINTVTQQCRDEIEWLRERCEP